MPLPASPGEISLSSIRNEFADGDPPPLDTVPYRLGDYRATTDGSTFISAGIVGFPKGFKNTIPMPKDIVTSAGQFKIGIEYEIVSLGNTDFRLIGASTNLVGASFIARGLGTGTGTAKTKLRQISFSNFHGSAKFITETLESMPAFSSTGKLDTAVFGSGRISEDNNYHARISNQYLEFTTGDIAAGYTLTLPITTANFANSFTQFIDKKIRIVPKVVQLLEKIPIIGWITKQVVNYVEEIFEEEIIRYYRTRNFGYQVKKSNGTVIGTYTGSSAEVIGTSLQSRTTGGPYTIDLDPNTTYRIYYYLEFMADAFSGTAAGSRTSTSFTGSTVQTAILSIVNK